MSTSISFLPGCTGEAFTALDDLGTVDASTDASSDAAPALDAGKDAQDAAKDVELDALADASTDGDADAIADADAGDPDHDAGDGDASEDDAGDAGGDAGDAAADALDDACEPLIWYADEDGDGWGVESNTIKACDHPGKGWVAKKGDCDDTNPDVHPSQTEFFAQGYIRPGTSDLSFDYDCDGKELADGNPDTSDGSCSLLGGLCQGKDGYLAVEPVRTGVGVNRFCGSPVYFTCSLGLGCKSSTSTKEPIRCR